MKNNSRIVRVSQIMRLLTWITLAALPAVSVWLWMDIDRWAGTVSGFPIRLEFIGVGNRVAACLASMLPNLVIMAGLWRLQQLFHLFTQSEFFSLTGARHLQLFALSLVVSVLVSPIADGITSIALSWNYPPGEHALSIQFGSQDLTTLFIAAVFFIVAWVFREAQLLARENASFI